MLIKSNLLDISKSLTKILVFKNDSHLICPWAQDNYAIMNYNKEEYK